MLKYKQIWYGIKPTHDWINSTLQLWSTLVLFGQFGLVRSYLIHFGSIWSILSTSVLFSPHRSYSVHFSLVCSLQFDLVPFSPLCPLRSYSVHSVYLFSIQSYFVHLVHLIPFGFSPFRLFQFILVHFDLFLCTYIMGKDIFGLKAPNLNPNLSLYTYIHTYIHTYIYIYIYLNLVISKILSISSIIATLFLSHINVAFQSASVLAKFKWKSF